MLVENYLVAVVSLPAGCFNPYSGVKTSILILDKALARQSKTIAFFKVENDGFGLGAQRRPIEKNDLPQVQAELNRYLQGFCTGQFSANQDEQFSAKGAPPSQPGALPQENVVLDGKGLKARANANDRAGFQPSDDFPNPDPGALPQENVVLNGKGLKARANANDRAGFQPSDDFPNPDPGALPQAEMSCAVGAQFTCGLIVPKERIAANGDYNLSGERYREGGASNHQFPQVELGTLCKPEYGFTASAEDKGDARFVRITDIAPDGRIRKDEPKFIKLSRESEPYLLQKGDLLVARTGATYGKTMLFDEEYPAVFASYLIRLRFPKDKLLPEFYWSFAQSEKYWEQARNLATGGGQPQFNGNALTQIKIPLPPLEVQKEIVAEIEGYQREIQRLKAEIAAQETNIQKTISRIWGEEESDRANGAPPSQLGATPQENVHKIGKG